MRAEGAIQLKLLRAFSRVRHDPAALGINQVLNDDQIRLDLRQVREDAEKRVIISALGRVDGNVLKAAEMLGISRPTLYDLMHRFGLK